MAFNSVYGGFTGLPGDGGGGSPSGPAGGDLTGTYPDPSIAANAVTFAKFQQAILGTSIVARQPSTAGNFAELQATTNGQILARQSGILGFFDGSTIYMDLISNQSAGGIKTFTGTSTQIQNLLINDSLTYKTALSVPSVGVLGIGIVDAEFTSFQIGNISARNGFQLLGATSTNPITVQAAGIDANIGVTIRSKGNGGFRFEQDTGSNPFGSFTVGGGGAGGRFTFGNEILVPLLQVVGATTNFGVQVRALQVNRNLSPTVGVLSNYIYIDGNIGQAATSAGSIDAITFSPSLGTNNALLNRISFIQSSLASASNRWNLYLDGTAQNYINGNTGFGVTNPTALIDLSGSTTARASLRIRSGSAPTGASILDGNIDYLTTNNRLMFRRNTTDVEILAASTVTTEAVVTDTTLTIQYNGVTYKLLAKA